MCVYIIALVLIALAIKINFNTKVPYQNFGLCKFGDKINILTFFATEMIHYTKVNTTINIDQNAEGDPQIEISTIDSRRLERSRQFEVKLTYSVPAPFISIQPDTVNITITDRDGKHMHMHEISTCIQECTHAGII